MNAVEFCQLVESRLGWIPAGGATNDKPWIRYRADASKVVRKQQEDPELYTWENLRAAVALLAHEKKTRTPVGVFAWVPRALELKAEPESVVETQIREAIAIEAAKGDPDLWAVSLNRAVGPYRRQLLHEWKAQQ